ncbi:MAG: HAD-IIIC family phosphatase [Planctomycetia bacterium]|nr:HAD-IIIC family phosphatase [Planctomycetia bacterium]
MHWTVRIALAAWGLFYMMYCPMLAVLALAGFMSCTSISATLSPVGWMLAGPLLYLSWLILTLAIFAFDNQVAYLAGNRKPQRATTSDGFRVWFSLLTTFGWYFRGFLVRSLPLAHCLQLIPLVRWLVVLAYSPRAHLGRDSTLFGYIYDPDLTEIGEQAIIGGGVRICAHSLLMLPDGVQAYASSPIFIGPRVVIGGESRIGPGVQIGSDGLVEAGSVVAPFTVIPANEIWGGNPAIFLRKRSDAATARNDGSPASLVASVDPVPGGVRPDEEESIRQLVADALGMPVANVCGNLSAEDAADWDSLAQMAIAASLNVRMGVQVTAAEAGALRSIPAIVDLVRKKRSFAPPVASMPSAPNNPELLPLFDRELMTRVLSERSTAGVAKSGEPVQVVIAATFTAEPLAAALKLWTSAFGIPVQIEFAAYNQVPQALLAADSAFDRNKTGINVVLVRPEDLLDGPEQMHDEAVGGLLDSISRFAARSPGALVVATLPAAVSAFFGVDRQTVDRFRTSWQTRLGQIAGVETVDFAAIVERLGIDASRSSEMEVVARAPYSAAVYRDLGIEIARTIRSHRKAPAKVLALDADGVLWGGVIGEDGIHGVHLGPDHPGRAFQLFQRQILEIKRRGILLVLVSRNNADDVWRMIEGHPDMILQRGDFATARINWKPKSQNLRELAQELNLGLDAFVFVDDDPANRLDVETNAGGVTVVPLPPDAAEYCQTLSRLWCFDTPVVTAEDGLRTAMMQQEHLRQESRAGAIDMHVYLKSLELVVQMRPAEMVDLARVAQLTQKTNQFNLSLKRRSLAEIQALGRDLRIYVIQARDRFGDYGLVGACILDSDPGRTDELRIDTLLLSCRALGRGVEEALLYGLRTIVEARGATRLTAQYVAGPRNVPVLEFLQRHGFRESGQGTLEHDRPGELALPAYVAWEGPCDDGVRRAG